MDVSTAARPKSLTCYVCDGAIFEAKVERVLPNGVFVPCERDDIQLTSSVRVDFHSDPPLGFTGQVATWVKGRGVRIEADPTTPKAIFQTLERWSIVEPPPPPKDRKHILVIDDDANILRMLDRRLSRLGFEVSTAQSPPDALTKLNTHIDAVLLDWLLPAIPGSDVLRTIRKEHEHVPIAVISGALWWDDAENEILKQGASAVIPKPLDLERIAGWIQSVTR